MLLNSIIQNHNNFFMIFFNFILLKKNICLDET